MLHLHNTGPGLSETHNDITVLGAQRERRAHRVDSRRLVGPEEGIAVLNDRIHIHKTQQGTDHADLAQDVRYGLTGIPKTLPPKYFYDERGSELFEQICDTPEYYLTRVEHGLLQDVVNDVVALTDPAVIVELGSGSSKKTEVLLRAAIDEVSPLRYISIDISEQALVEAGERLIRRFSPLTVDVLVADYENGLNHERVRNGEGNKLFVFLGGTIGNFEHDDAVELISSIRAQMDDDDRLLLGADRVKDTAVLDRAYNDEEGVTAQFNKNVLRVINRELDAAFDLESFEHRAFYDPHRARIEMHLVSRLSQQVTISALDLTVGFDRRESILTEISRKFTVESLARLFREADMVIERHYEPENGYFSLIVARPQ